MQSVRVQATNPTPPEPNVGVAYRKEAERIGLKKAASRQLDPAAVDRAAALTPSAVAWADEDEGSSSSGEDEAAKVDAKEAGRREGGKVTSPIPSAPGRSGPSVTSRAASSVMSRVPSSTAVGSRAASKIWTFFSGGAGLAPMVMAPPPVVLPEGGGWGARAKSFMANLANKLGMKSVRGTIGGMTNLKVAYLCTHKDINLP